MSTYRHLHFNLSFFCTPFSFVNIFKNVSYPFSWSFHQNLFIFFFTLCRSIKLSFKTNIWNTNWIHATIPYHHFQWGQNEDQKLRQIRETNKEKQNNRNDHFSQRRKDKHQTRKKSYGTITTALNLFNQYGANTAARLTVLVSYDFFFFVFFLEMAIFCGYGLKYIHSGRRICSAHTVDIFLFI